MTEHVGTGLPADDIAFKIRDIMQASGDFDDYYFCIDELPTLPANIQYLCEIVFEGERVTRVETGSVDRYFFGFIRLARIQPATFEFDVNQTAINTGARLLKADLNKLVILFSNNTYLGNLAFDSGAVVARFQVDDGEVDYRVTERDENNYIYQGSIPAVCLVKEPDTA